MTRKKRFGYVMRKYFLAFGLTLATGMASAEENASNPLSAVNNVDLRWQYTSADPGDTHDVFVDGAYMLLPVLKLKYELHYNFTDVTGSDENDFEKVVIKPLYFPYQSKLNEEAGPASRSGRWIDLPQPRRSRSPHCGRNRFLSPVKEEPNPAREHRPSAQIGEHAKARIRGLGRGDAGDR